MSQTKAQLLNPLGDFELTGQLVGVGATFSGNVSIAGTLTKQDVTNVDSVGVITARSGIKVTAGGIDCTGITSITGADDTDNFVIDVGGGSQFVVHTDSSDGEISLRTQDGSGNNYSKYMTFFTQPSGAVVAPRLTITSSGGLKYHNADSPTNANSQAQILNHTGGLQIYGSSDSGTNRNIIFGTNSVAAGEVLRITSSGSVGINSTSPSASEKLTIRGGTSDSAKFTFHSYADFLGASDAWEGYSALFRGSKASNPNSQWLGIGATTAYGWIDFANNSASKITITSTGVGLGVNNPEGLLHLFGDNNTNGPELYLTVNNNNTTDNIGALVYGNNADKTLLKIQGLTHTANNTGDLTFHTSTAGTMGERLRIGSSGQIGIAGANYGNAGQVLTSGGSGSAISWADAAGGAEYAGISSGAISAGNPVVVRNDGKLEKVKYSWTASLSPNPAGDSNLVQPSSSAMQDYSLAFWSRNSDGTFLSGTNPMVSFFYKSSSNTPSWRSSEVTSGTTNMVHTQSSGFNQGDGIGEFDGKWNPVATASGGGGRLLLAFNRTSYHGGKPAVQVMRGPYSNGVWTQGAIYDINNTAAQGGISVGWHDANRWVVVYGQGGNYYGNVVTLTGSTSVSLGSGTTIETGLTQMSYRGSMSDADDNGKHIVFYAAKTTGNRNSWRYSVATVSGTSVSFGTPNWLGDDANPGLAIGDLRPEISFDPDQNRFLVVYYKQTATNGGGGINKIFARNAIISGTSVTWSAETQISAQNARGYDTVFDSNLKKHVVYLQDQSTSKVVYHLVNFTGSAAPSTNTEADAYSGSKELLDLGMDYDSTYGMVIVGGRKGNDGNNLAEFVQKTATSSTNLTADNFIGLSKGNYTDGQTAKVNTNGSLDENQSSLTIGQKYFVQKDGTLATSKEASAIAYAGQAVSSTNLLVSSNTIPQTTEGILGYWEWGLCENQFMPWCAGNRFMGAYDNDGGSSSCNFCFGKWYCQDCRYGDKHQAFDFTANIPDSAGGNMCLCTGGYCCNGIGTCCCSWNSSCPDGRFGFPSPGLYCYNLEMQWGFCSAMAQGGCMALTAMFAGKKCRNTACDTWYCDVNGYTFNMNHCNFCQKNFEYHNVRLSGKLPVADTSVNIISFRMWENGIGAQIRGDGICNLNQTANYGCYGSRVSFTKISNNPGYFYC